MNTPSRLHLAAAVAALTTLSTYLVANPTFTASLTTQTGIQNSPTPLVLIGSEDRPGGFHGEGSVRAGAVLAGRAQASAPAAGFNNGLGETFTFDTAGAYDDILIAGGAPGDHVPFTLHLPFHAVFNQQWSSLVFSSFTDISSPSNGVDFRATIFAPISGPVSGRFILNPLINSLDTAAITTEGNVTATGNYGPPSTVVHQDTVTEFHNIPVDPTGFLNIETRTQVAISNNDIFDPGIGLSRADIIQLRGEIELSGIAISGTPMLLSMVLSASSSTSGSFFLPALAAIDATNTFGPPQDGSPVFDLPQGYTASSISLNILDNHVIPAPEPGTFILLAIGFLHLTKCRR